MPKTDDLLTKDLPKVSIVIATYNMAHLIRETLWSCCTQKYPNIEIIVYDDCSTDRTSEVEFEFYGAKYIRGVENRGVGRAFNAGMQAATGDFIVTMCADDLFTDNFVIFDYVGNFLKFPGCGVIGRYYYQFIDGDPLKKPCRAWRTNEIVVQANNPSGLAFRRTALHGNGMSNKMFIESSKLVKDITLDLWGHAMMKYDTVAVRVHDSTSNTKDYWLKRRVSSPVMDWWSLECRSIARDYTSLIQIKSNFVMSAVLEEIWNFIRLRPINLIRPDFWFFSLVAILVPRSILRKIPSWYRWNIGRRITKEVKRPCIYN